MQGRLMLLDRDISKRSADTNSPKTSSFVFSHADVLALRVEYHAPSTWHYLKADSHRRETIHFRLTAVGVQPAYDSFHIDIVDANQTTGSAAVQNGVDHVTGNRSRLIAAALTSGLAVTAAVVAVVAVVVTVFHRRKSRGMADKRSAGARVSAGENGPPGGVQLPEVVLVAVSNVPASDGRAPPAVVREPIGIDWRNVDPEILQHCRTTDPILHSEKVWV